MYAKRREDILAMLKETSPLAVKEIAERLLVSEMTVRRDLTQMEKEGLVKRSFGSASLSLEGVKPEFLQSVMQRTIRASEAKKRIAEAAAALVRRDYSHLLSAHGPLCQRRHCGCPAFRWADGALLRGFERACGRELLPESLLRFCVYQCCFGFPGVWPDGLYGG